MTEFSTSKFIELFSSLIIASNSSLNLFRLIQFFDSRIILSIRLSRIIRRS